MSRPTKCMLTGAVVFFVYTGEVHATAVQAAKITAMVLGVEHSLSGSERYTKSKVGTMLPAGSRVRTGKRSKCEIRFPDGSIVRMGPTTDLVLLQVTDRNMHLQKGRLFAQFVPGNAARIQGGSAVAAIKGTTLEYTTTPNPDGTFTDTCTVYETTAGVDFLTSAGTLTLTRGLGTSHTGTLPTALGTAEPTAEPEAPTTGTEAPTTEPTAPAPTTELTAPAPTTAPTPTTAPAPTGPGPSPVTTVAPPLAVPQPPQEFSGGSYTTTFNGLNTGGSQQATPGTDAGVQLVQDSYAVVKVVEAVLPGTDRKQDGYVDVVIQGLGSQPQHMAGAQLQALPRLGQVATAAVGAALQQPPVPRTLFGKRFFGPYAHTDVFALWGDPASIAGLRVHPSAILGDWYLEVGGTGTHNFRGHWRTRLTEAFAAVRPGEDEITIGRQHFVREPVNNADLGTVLTFDTLDAVRW